MTYFLKNHTYRHAVEEMLAHLLPASVLEQVFAEDGADVIGTLETGTKGCTATVQYLYQGKWYSGYYEGAYQGDTVLERRRVESEAVRLSLYRAILPTLAQKPVWGSLTGVRPAKLARNALERGQSNTEVAKLLQEHYDVNPVQSMYTIRVANVAMDDQTKIKPNGISLYISIPFCPSRCAYCSFVSASIHRVSHLIAPYIELLCKEIAFVGELLKQSGRQVQSIYIGGGTPTTLSAQELRTLMCAVAQSVDVSNVLEYTVEAGRADTITEEKLFTLLQGGATRISINPQTMTDAVLKGVGRLHTAQDVIECYHQARNLGFASINMDLIAGLDGETVASFAQSVDQLLLLQPDNITVHTLAIKRSADLQDKASNTQKGAEVASMLTDAGQKLTQAGYAPYYLYRQKFTAGGFENIGWSKEGKECFYNIVMMEELQDIVSVGAGGVSKRIEKTGKIKRLANCKYPVDYLRSEKKIYQQHRLLLGGNG